MLKRTPFYDFHIAAGARMVEYAGWEMPILYRSIVAEHEQTRASGSLFDVSHMGRLLFTGPDTAKFLDRALTRNVSEQKVGQSRYSLVCNEAGGVLDDVIVSRDAKNWFLVCNASNRDKIVNHFTLLRKQLSLDFDMADQTESTAMIALQGPKVIARISQAMGTDLSLIKRYHFQTVTIMMVNLTVARSGYTGEDGVEIIFPAKMAAMAIKMLDGRSDKEDATIKPAGLGARDTLRLEAAMPLYGHELTESIDPITAGLAWAVDLKKEFIGVEALRVIASSGPARKLVGLVLEGRRIARQGTPITSGAAIVGEVTSGTFGPTVGSSVAMALVDSNYAAEGTQLSADVKGAPTAAKVVKLPFYKRPA